MELLLDVKGCDDIVVNDEEIAEEISQEQTEPSIIQKITGVFNSALSTNISPLAKALAIALTALLVIIVSVGIAGILFGIYTWLSSIISALPHLGLPAVIILAALIAATIIGWLFNRVWKWIKQLPIQRQKKIKNFVKIDPRKVVNAIRRRQIEMD
ncbi:MAG: hypothetical protein UT24_C0011G0049 [Candidatus Woesebacteria bacterium GW2011_GWB1_39_12]|uniref:Uncharacterized protein n=1 Tax=Candidatus Woesebacteria bacterium GW2011_GWB1_39_12 TaxID=1618574 RepID=A0A0G0MJR8_9BACT|nr:MAG: hypothetical protein UT24_C0011G0049 [Candidatus Woesebacteria bacterium GW2011_GWB1_39_12]